MNSKEYQSPFTTRYCSSEMSKLFSAYFRALTFRKLWIELAKAQKKFGLPISEKQIEQMEQKIEDLNFDQITIYEKKFRHDVMAHIHAFGDQCPDAKPIIHWGATSSYVTDNADLIQLKEALFLLFQKLRYILQLLAKLAEKHANEPCLSYTHFQPAQPTTIGKRICLWLQDFFMDAQEWVRVMEELPFLGAKGATGTQSSFLSLFEGNHQKVKDLEKTIAAHFGFQKIIPISGQTYPRKIDLLVLNTLESFASSAHKFGTDLRLLAHEGEILESFEKTQVGSSAMPYKRNPIYCERICGISRFTISISQNPAYTAATQWLERSLDDSSNRRLAIPEAFLSVDATLNLLVHVIEGMQVEVNTAKSHFQQHLPLLCMENILMEGVKRGASRQELHEKLRKITFESMKGESPFEQLVQAVEKDFHISRATIEEIASPERLTGRASAQVTEFLESEIEPFLRKHPLKNPLIPKIEI